MGQIPRSIERISTCQHFTLWNIYIVVQFHEAVKLVQFSHLCMCLRVELITKNVEDFK